MTNPIARPTFFEGEILPAADLGATVDYARNQMARHSRYLHSWGIATGLKLQAGSSAANGSVPVTLTAGTANDGTGREIVLTADYPLDSTLFLQQVVPQSDKTLLYPVFLTGLDQTAPPSSNLTGACNTGQSTRVQETAVVSFGSPGRELQVAGQAVPALTDGPDGGGATLPWLVLVGFVTWDVTIPGGNFTGAQDANPTNGIGRQYVGVNAGQVISQSGSLLLATHPATPQGQNPVMALELQEAPNDGQLVFGKLGADGTVTPALTVLANGNVIAAGQISGAVTPGSMQVQSGIAFDGMILPLPPGINPADAAAGKVTVHTHVTVHYESLSPPRTFLMLPVECRVDTSTRRVHCTVVDLIAGPPFINLLPAWCDYVVIVAVPAASGSGS